MEIQSNIKKVAIYSRKSRPDETDEVLQRQLQVLIDMAEQNKWEWDVFQEIGSSMSINEKDRPELNKLLNKIQSYEYDGVLVTDADRISRDIGHMDHIKKILESYGVKLITTTKVYDYNKQEDVLMSDMMAIVAKQEYMNTKKRLIRGRRTAAKQGRWQGRVPMGYKKEQGILVVDEETKPIITRIYKLYLQDGLSSNEISRKLEIEGVRAPTGAIISPEWIGAILRQEAYKGVSMFGRTKQSKTEKTAAGNPKLILADEEEQIRVENAHEAIISPEDWDKVASIRAKRNSNPIASRIGKNPFSSLISCTVCGRKHSFQREKNGKIRVQGCQTRNYHEGETSYTLCPNQGIYLSEFEKGFYVELAKFTSQLEDNLEVIKANVNEENTKSLADEVASLNKSTKAVESRIKKIQEAFVLGIMDSQEAQQEIKKYKGEKSELEKQLEIMSHTTQEDRTTKLENLILRLKELLKGTSSMPAKDINDLFKTYIEKIEYSRVAKVKRERNVPITIQIHYKHAI